MENAPSIDNLSTVTNCKTEKNRNNKKMDRGFKYYSIVVFFFKLLMAAFLKFWHICTTGILILILCFWLYGSLTALSLLILALVGLLYNTQDMLLYHPDEPNNSRIYVESPATLKLEYENIFVKTTDGVKINLVLIKQPSKILNEAPTVIFFHGNAGNIGHRLLNAHALFSYCGCNVLLVEYRGYGKSSGKPHETGLYNDAETALDYIIKRVDINQSKIIVFGRSLGGAVAFNICSSPLLRGRINALIVENTFTSIPDMAKHMFNIKLLDVLPLWCYKNKFMSSWSCRHIQVPTLFLSGSADTLVPPRMMQNLFDACNSPMKRFAAFPRGTHNETWQRSGYYDSIIRFINEVKDYSSAPSSVPPVALYKLNPGDGSNQQV